MEKRNIYAGLVVLALGATCLTGCGKKQESYSDIANYESLKRFEYVAKRGDTVDALTREWSEGFDVMTRRIGFSRINGSTDLLVGKKYSVPYGSNCTE